MDRKIKGLTIIEIVIVISIIAVLLSIAIPAFLKKRNAYNIQNDINTLYSILQEGRMKAFAEKIELELTINGKSYCLQCSRVDTDCINQYGNNCILSGTLHFDYPDTTVSISKRGTFKQKLTIGYPSSNEANKDCLKISNIKVSMEKCDGSF